VADGGTIFLDESVSSQGRPKRPSARTPGKRNLKGWEAASHCCRREGSLRHDGLRAAVEAGHSGRISLPTERLSNPHALASRRMDDIPLLVEYLIDHYSKKVGKKIRNIDKKTLQLFQTTNGLATSANCKCD